MRSFRRLPPLLRVVSLLGVLAILVSLGISTWVWQLDQKNGKAPEHLQLVGWVILELGLVYSWMVTAYNVRHPARFAPTRRPARAAPWLDTWRGQLMSALVASAVPMATIIAALVVSSNTPLVSLAYPVNMVFLVICFVWFVVFGCAMS